MDLADNPASPKGKAATRSSLACLPCRSRHRKCDGVRPRCSRCAEVAIHCHYAKSKRGGLDRAALAERRRRLGLADDCSPTTDLDGVPSLTAIQPRALSPPELVEPVTQQELQDGGFFLDSSGHALAASTSATSGPIVIENDALVNSYYNNFHKFHPLVVPRAHLSKLNQNPIRQPSLKPLIAVLRFIGRLYSFQEWSNPLQDSVEASFAEASQTNPFMVQCRLLYSIALFWYGHIADSQREMEAAVRLALGLEMFRGEFATDHGGRDVVLTESWRRTWWMLFVVDGYYAGTLGTMKPALLDIEATVELPCEEVEFESGEIPEPQTLHDFDCREFAADDISFSSFAYLIGAVRCVVLAMSTAPELAAKEASAQVIQAADSIVDGWLLLLPKGRKQVLAKSGKIDELMFQAHMVIHVAMINLHRPLSDLKFNQVEEVSSCARDPPADTPGPELINVHTVRVLRSVEAQIRLLALPVRPFSHTPFVTCMVNEGTLALLSACNFLLKGKELAVARDQIRLTVGCLKALGEIWPRTARNLQEIQTIARHVLGLDSKGTASVTPESSEVPSLSGGEAQMTSGSETRASSIDLFPATDAMDSVYGWCKFGELDLDLSRWMNES
ncbi:hypothetical protein B0J13DRAFT_564256 [Dactylonectria estremocensis]|uniref:Zn(2)-C6 fungal-type domain-containing protein n=1 Tax=Dactylonectria estremocensis TaxID=1079267 RepID=A0A9P9IQM7_9HYPO|nr:hypothetical protein B0J13DRAFT_564256 [Dactylonectria estremocensis]